MNNIENVNDNNKFYEILNIGKNASQNEIKKAYHKLIIKWHPDKNMDNLEEAKKRFIEIDTAYRILSDPNKRKLYDSGIKIDERELRTCKKFTEQIFNAQLFKENIEEVINSMEEGEKDFVFGLVNGVYDDREEFLNDFKERNIEKIVEKFNTSIKLFIKEMTFWKLLCLFFNYIWYFIKHIFI